MPFDALGIVANAVLPITLAIAIGFCLTRTGRRLDVDSLTLLATDFALPALTFGSLVKAAMPWAEFARMGAAAIVSLALLGGLGAVLLRCAGLRVRTYVPSLTWGNGVFIGYPVALYAFGNIGLTHAIAFAAGQQVFNCTLVDAYAAGAMNWKAVLRSPLLFAAATGISVHLLGVPVPAVVVNSCSLLGGMTVPLMLILVGRSLAGIPVKNIARATVLSMFRIALGAAIALAVSAALGLTGVARAILILQCSMPVAVLTYVFAQRWNNDPDEAAALVVVSTWLSVVSIPVLLGSLLR
jgi:predicted permease